MNIKITNVITTADIKQKVDITKFNDYPWGIYDNELYRGRCGYIKDNSMEGRVTVFYTGKLISTGAKSIEKSIEQLKKAIELMVNANLIKYVEIKPKVQNIIALIDTNKKIDIESLAVSIKCIYEPDQFPGLIYRLDRFTLLIFASGKIVVAGAKSINDIDEVSKIVSMINFK